MAFTSAGGREFYNDAIKLTSGTTNCIQKGRIKGIIKSDNTAVRFYFPSGCTIELTPANAQIFPFSPVGVTFAAGNAFGLY